MYFLCKYHWAWGGVVCSYFPREAWIEKRREKRTRARFKFTFAIGIVFRSLQFQYSSREDFVKLSPEFFNKVIVNLNSDSDLITAAPTTTVGFVWVKAVRYKNATTSLKMSLAYSGFALYTQIFFARISCLNSSVVTPHTMWCPSQATLGKVSTWMGDPSKTVILPKVGQI